MISFSAKANINFIELLPDLKVGAIVIQNTSEYSQNKITKKAVPLFLYVALLLIFNSKF